MAPLLVLILLGAIAALPFVVIARRGLPSRRWLARPSGGMLLAAAIPMAALLFFLSGEGPGGDVVAVCVMVVLAAGLVLAWLREFCGLMAIADDAFPGRFDKLIWAGLMILIPPVGLITFYLFRRAYWPAEKPAPEPASELI